MIQLDDKKKLLISNFALLATVVVILSQSGYWVSHASEQLDISNVQWQLAGEIFMMLAFLIMISSFFFNHKFAVYGALAGLGLGLFMIAIGWFSTDTHDLNESYSLPCQIFWQALALAIIGVLNLALIHNQLQTEDLTPIPLDNKKYLLLTSISLLLLQISIMTYFGWFLHRFLLLRDQLGSMWSSSQWIVAGQVFGMIAFLVCIAPFFFNHKFIPIGLFALLGLSFVLVFIGMCNGMSAYDGMYDYAASAWWTQFGIVILGLLNVQAYQQQLQEPQETTDYVAQA